MTLKKKMQEAMQGPADFDRCWKLMEENGIETLQIKLFKEEGDKHPFRAVILVNGKTAVKEVLALVDKREE